MIEQTEKKVLVLSDDDFLFDVIESNLAQINLAVDRIKPISPTENIGKTELFSNGRRKWDLPNADNIDLIMVALSAPKGEPVVTLFDASLLGQIGQTPLLIISEREFEANQEGLIFHLQFPFNSGELRHTVQTLLVPPH
jgi:hypothetical protein